MQAVLEQHRAKSKLDANELVELLYRSKDRFERVQKTFALMEEFGVNPHPTTTELSRVDVFALSTKLTSQLRADGRILDLFYKDNPMEECWVPTNFQFPGSVGSLMTTSIISYTGSETQVKEWFPNVKNYVWLCCYAQTELGTGSDVQNLQTMAVFDPKTQEFVFHSPTTASIKWWPGDLGISCSHGAVFARLISNGKDHGVQAFFVELRDPKTHIPHKGVEVGDIGPKLGYNSKDNGFLKFTQYRASKNCLLSKYINVDQEGNVTKRGNPRQMYSGMMRTRTALLTMSTNPLSKACTIAFRYSLFRTQFTDKHGHPMRIYDYQQQRTKLFHALSQVYMMNLSQAIALKHIEENNFRAEKDDFSMLQSTHIMLCCLKPMFTEWSAKRIEDLMKCCGGHGFSNYSGLPLHFKETFPNQILEGENSVLLLQVTRFLLKLFA